MNFWLLCRPILRPSAVAHALRHVRRHRIRHAVKRIAHAATGKPAIVGYTCIVVGGGFWAGWPSGSGGSAPVSGGQFADIAPLLPTEFLLPPLALGGEVFSAPGAETPLAVSFRTLNREGQPTQVPEPASLALLATAVATMAWWLTSKRESHK